MEIGETKQHQAERRKLKRKLVNSICRKVNEMLSMFFDLFLEADMTKETKSCDSLSKSSMFVASSLLSNKLAFLLLRRSLSWRLTPCHLFLFLYVGTPHLRDMDWFY